MDAPFLNILDPEFVPESPEVAAAREATQHHSHSHPRRSFPPHASRRIDPMHPAQRVGDRAQPEPARPPGHDSSTQHRQARDDHMRHVRAGDAVALGAGPAVVVVSQPMGCRPHGQRGRRARA